MIEAALNIGDPSVLFLLIIVWGLVLSLAIVLITHSKGMIGFIVFMIALILLVYIGVQLHVIGR